MFLKEQTELINNHLKAGALKGNRFQAGRFIPLARLATRGEIAMPIELNVNNEAAWVGIDDTYPIIIYHRKLNSVYSINPDEQRGRKNNVVRENTDMLMVVFAKFANVKMTAEQLEAQIVAGFPDVIATPPNGLNNMVVTAAQSSSDSEAIFNNEYKNTPYKLAPEDIMLSVRYSIQTQFNKGCFDFCCDGEN